MKKLLYIFLMTPFAALTQSVDLSLDSVFQRSDVGTYFDRGLDYYTIALSQVRPISFSGILSNMGSSDLTNCFLSVKIMHGGVDVFDTNSDTTDLIASASDSLYAAETFTPSEVGDYQVIIWTNSDSLDENPVNDTLYINFSVDANQFSRSDGNITGNCKLPDDSLLTVGVFAVGNVYKTTNDLCLEYFEVFIPDTSINEGQILYGNVLKLDTVSMTWVYAEPLDEHTVTASELNSEIMMGSSSWGEGGYPIIHGTIFAIMIGSYTSSMQFAHCQKVENYSVLWELDGVLTTMDSARAFQIRMVVDGCTGSVQSTEPIISEVNPNFPNPFSTTTQIAYTLSKSGSVELRVMDVSGKELFNEKYGQQAPGEHSIEIDRGHLPAGIYFYSLIAGNEAYTGKMVVR